MMSEHTPYGDCPEIEICPEVDCDTCRKSVEPMFIISEEQLKAIEKWDTRHLGEEYRARPLSSTLKAEREKMLDDLQEWFSQPMQQLVNSLQVQQKLKSLRSEP